MTACLLPPMSQPAPDACRRSLWSEMTTHDDWWAIWLGGLILIGALVAVLASSPKPTEDGKGLVMPPAIGRMIGTPGPWKESPVESFTKNGKSVLPGVAAIGGLLLVLLTGAQVLRGQAAGKFAVAFVALFLLAIASYVLAGQAVLHYYNLEYVLWALLLGMVISNTIGTPAWLKPAVLPEFFIKTGLVLLGAEVLFGLLLRLGIPGIIVSWVTTPVVFITTYLFGQKLLKIESKSLNIVISADMSVCGVSAAIATGAACRAKKEEISLAIGLSLVFTAFMMILQPAFAKAVGMDEKVAGAWMGGTIDSTGAVAAAGKLLGPEAEKVATTVKMIQNVLIGVMAFAVAVYWTTRVEANPDGPRPTAWEIWYRFPKFVLGFLAASLIFSVLYYQIPSGEAVIGTLVTKGITTPIRGWLFCLAFVAIGLDTNFRELLPYMKAGKPLVLYVVGQTLNLLLSFVMAWLMFGVLFRDALK
jgi:uncharacterized integral membrane protein (TIGR00698 family)